MIHLLGKYALQELRSRIVINLHVNAMLFNIKNIIVSVNSMYYWVNVLNWKYRGQLTFNLVLDNMSDHVARTWLYMNRAVDFAPPTIWLLHRAANPARCWTQLIALVWWAWSRTIYEIKKYDVPRVIITYDYCLDQGVMWKSPMGSSEGDWLKKGHWGSTHPTCILPSEYFKKKVGVKPRHQPASPAWYIKK